MTLKSKNSQQSPSKIEGEDGSVKSKDSPSQSTPKERKSIAHTTNTAITIQDISSNTKSINKNESGSKPNSKTTSEVNILPEFIQNQIKSSNEREHQ